MSAGVLAGAKSTALCSLRRTGNETSGTQAKIASACRQSEMGESFSRAQRRAGKRGTEVDHL
jgi:hypothetical protein